MKTILRFPRNVRETRPSSRWHHVYLQMGWNVQTSDPNIGEEEARRFMDFWHPDGCIVNNDRLHARLFKGVPTVFTHRDERSLPQTAALVSYDERAIAELAARELLSLHCASYVYIPEGRNEYWDRIREREFLRAMRTNFKSARVFPPPPEADLKTAFQCELAKWICQMPRPVGIFASYDLVAAAVISACYHARLSVPGDVLLLSVDNDVAVCENSAPTISSIFFNDADVFTATTDLLAKMMDGPRTINERRLIAPGGVMYRSSTTQLRKPDPYTVAARELIRTKACDGLSAQNVAALFPCARRRAEIRFREATGHSILEEIRETRRAKAKALLATGTKAEAVANLCGYSSRISLYRLLKESHRRI